MARDSENMLPIHRGLFETALEACDEGYVTNTIHVVAQWRPGLYRAFLGALGGLDKALDMAYAKQITYLDLREAFAAFYKSIQAMKKAYERLK
jgi:hypothetical protein